MLKLVLLLPVLTSASFLLSSKWQPSERLCEKGHLLLGVLLPVHDPNPYGDLCATLEHERGVHRVEAILFALKEVNRLFMPRGIKLGADIRDSCGDYIDTLGEAIDLVSDRIVNQDLVSSYGVVNEMDDLGCQEDRVVGVIGPTSSADTIAVAHLYSILGVPQISYASTSPDLSDKSNFRLFLRTVPSDRSQVMAMLDLIQALEWKSVHVLYSNGNYGQRAHLMFLELAEALQLCIVANRDLGDRTNYTKVILDMQAEPTVRGVVLFCQATHIRRLFTEVKQLRKSGYFAWISAEAWGTTTRFLKGLEDVAQGALVVSLQSATIPGFVEHFRSINPLTTSNIWFKKFWEEHFVCNLDNITCATESSLEEDYMFDDKVPYVIDAVFAFGQSIAWYLRKCEEEGYSTCGTSSFTCDDLVDFMHKQTFNGCMGSFQFDSHGDGIRGYHIWNFNSAQKPSYELIGSWNNSHRLHVNRTALRRLFRVSFCEQPCEPGSVRRLKKKSCCLACEKCDQNQIVQNEKCVQCPNKTEPSVNRTTCIKMAPDTHYEFWTMLMVGFAGIGIVGCFFVTSMFITNFNTALVKEAGRNSSFLILTGIFLLYSVAFFSLMDSLDTFCVIRRLGPPISCLFCYTPLVLRVVSSCSSTRKGYIDSFATHVVAVITLVILVSLLQVVGWTAMKPEFIEMVTRQNTLGRVCELHWLDKFLLYVPNLISMFVCLYFSYVRRKQVRTFMESKSVGLIILATIVVWALFYVVGVIEPVHYQASIQALTHCCSATILLVGLFARVVSRLLLARYRASAPSLLHVDSSKTESRPVSQVTAIESPGHLSDNPIVTALSYRL